MINTTAGFHSFSLPLFLCHSLLLSFLGILVSWRFNCFLPFPALGPVFYNPENPHLFRSADHAGADCLRGDHF